jgi:hypothetical protein
LDNKSTRETGKTEQHNEPDIPQLHITVFSLHPLSQVTTYIYGYIRADPRRHVQTTLKHFSAASHNHHQQICPDDRVEKLSVSIVAEKGRESDGYAMTNRFTSRSHVINPPQPPLTQLLRLPRRSRLIWTRRISPSSRSRWLTPRLERRWLPRPAREVLFPEEVSRSLVRNNLLQAA